MADEQEPTPAELLHNAESIDAGLGAEDADGKQIEYPNAADGIAAMNDRIAYLDGVLKQMLSDVNRRGTTQDPKVQASISSLNKELTRAKNRLAKFQAIPEEAK
jgi:hypothetical protein